MAISKARIPDKTVSKAKKNITHVKSSGFLTTTNIGKMLIHFTISETLVTYLTSSIERKSQ